MVNNIEILLDQLSNYIEDPNKIINNFICFYANNGRHRYSKVAKYINDKTIDDEQIVFFIQSNLNDLVRYCQANNVKIQKMLDEYFECNDSRYKFTVEELLGKFEKLQDHIQLEAQRLQFFTTREDKLFTTKIEDINNAIIVMKNDSENVSRKIQNSVSTSVISILGVFTAFITTFFGGLSVFGSIMNNIKGVSKFRLMFCILFLGLILFNICFVLIYSISKILDKNIGGWVSYTLCYEKPEKISKKISRKVKIKFKRFPIVILFNAFMVMCIFVLSVWFWKQ